MQGIPDVKAKQVLGYALLPGVVPRLQAFAASGFGWLASLMAAIYWSVRLLPPGHPYLNPANKGRFGIRHVMAAAANNLVFKWKNIDQIVVFFALLAGFVILILQFVLLLVVALLKPAMAMGGMFGTQFPHDDIAFMMLDRVFGIENMFNSCVVTTSCGGSLVTDSFPSPFNFALQSMFQFYSMAMLLVAVLIFLYYVLIVVGETAQSGTPFGRRFNHIWAPIRLVVALGLLVPLAHGLNSAQYITLYAAKLGSGFATNGWLLFNRELTNATGMQDRSLIANPRVPDVQHVVHYIAMARACKRAYEITFEGQDPALEIHPYIVKSSIGTPSESQRITGGGSSPSPDWQTALDFYDKGDILIRFGEKNEDKHGTKVGGVFPYCGEITVHTNDVTQSGPMLVQEGYYNFIMTFWDHPDIIAFADRAAAIFLEKYKNGGDERVDPCDVGEVSTGEDQKCGLPTNEFKMEMSNDSYTLIETTVFAARDQMIADTDFRVPDEIMKRGWGGAGIWYNRIAQWNGSLFGAVIAVPTPSKMPSVMEAVQEEKRKTDQNMSAESRYTPYLADGRPVHLADARETPIARMLSDIYRYWQSKTAVATDGKISGNIIFDTLKGLFGIQGLQDIGENADVHPMAQLVALGKSIVESAIRNLVTSLAFSALGGFTEMMHPHLGGAMHAISGIFVSLTTVGLTIGFVLYYVLPFMPFMYFFFAVGGWVKGIFEAMVGVPLWALAHLKIDGQGLPADTAMNGYFLIFEIFIRPILIVFGLLASMAIFAALVRVLHGIFPLVTENLTGFAEEPDPLVGIAPGIEFKRSIVDQFFFTIVYTIIVYMIGTSCFKLIDQIPNGILRWMGAGVASFNDQRGDAAEGLVQYAALGGATITSQGVGAMNQGMRAAGQAGGLLPAQIGRWADDMPAQNTVAGAMRNPPQQTP